MAYAEDFSDEDRARFARMREDAEKGRYQETLSWPDPVSLPEGLSPVAPFAVEMLPARIGPWVVDTSERLQCPADFVAVAAIVALGAVLGRRIGVKPQSATDSNLWGCIVARPGYMKSPAIAEALRPLHRLEVKASENFQSAHKDFLKSANEWKMRKGVAESQHKSALKKNPEARLIFDAEEPEEPAARRYVTNDCTYEKLGEILVQNPNGVLAHRDELVSLLKTLDSEQYAAARGFFLTAWSGTQPYRFDRIMRGSQHIEAACVSVIGTTQPGRLAEYIRRAVIGGAGDDGLIQRFGLLVWPDDPTAPWENVNRYANTAARNEAWGVFEDFECLDPAAVGAEIERFESVPCLRLAGDAEDTFVEWRRGLERELRSGNLPPALESHFAKYRKLVPALALINHLADGGSGPVSDRAMLRAISMGYYLESHAKRAYASGPEAETAAATAILERIQSGQLKDRFTARDIHQKRWKRLTDRGNVLAGLHLLCDLDWIMPQEQKPDGAGRHTTCYRINPKGTAR